GDGNDSLTGGSGADALYGGLGDDVYFTDGNDLIVEAAASGTDLVASSVNYTLGAALENLTLTGSGATRGTGNALSNTLRGNIASNILSGGGGNDRLWGGLGNDTLTGGSGRDIFVFNSKLRGANIDRVTDFRAVDDTIWLENAVFTRLAAGTLSTSAFRANATGLAGDASDRIIYETDTGKLYFDLDGTGSGKAVVFAVLHPGLSLTSADFFVF
ncbi:calcium-binding protein, partial [Rhodobacter sp. NSM]|uniref:calcium-binding protein n=1 Tax=Rhodobacter sp. NSM TaxID=3457501 RepID=UPI003FCFFAF1